MKTATLIACCFLYLNAARACDFCNCYLGLNPGYNYNSIGLRYKYRHAFLGGQQISQRTAHLGHGSEHTSLPGDLHEYYNDVELFGRFYPVPKLQLLFSVPYSYNSIAYGDKVEHMNAFADVTVQAYYQLANTMATDSSQVRHRLFAGGGIKFPTGKSSGSDGYEVPMAHHMLPGTGSTDYMLGISYIGKKHRLGWNADLNYKMNGSSESTYRYGNTFNATTVVFYEFGPGSVKLYPHAGTVFETGDQDTFQGAKVSASGGSMLFGSAGIDFYFGNLALANEFRIPLLTNLPEGMPADRQVFVVSINYNF